MGIFDKIIGKKASSDESLPKGEKKPEDKPAVSTDPKKKEKPEKKKEATADKAPKKSGAPKAEKPKKATSTGKKKVKKDNNIAHSIIFEQIISEKSTTLAAQNKYIFKVRKNASKFQIKEAVEGYYAVTVTSVNTIRISPKKRIQGRTIGWKKGFKKAIVTLQEGDTIAAAEGV